MLASRWCPIPWFKADAARTTHKAVCRVVMKPAACTGTHPFPLTAKPGVHYLASLRKTLRRFNHAPGWLTPNATGQSTLRAKLDCLKCSLCDGLSILERQS
jgi:hypothetical protein